LQNGFLLGGQRGHRRFWSKVGSGSLSRLISDILLAVGVRMGLTRDHSPPLPLMAGPNGTPPGTDQSLLLSLRADRNVTSSRSDHSLAVSSSILALKSFLIKSNCAGLAKIEADLVWGS